jgi:UDP-N-acetylmuramoyl-tripeptide--D-alanyl-D-alanine ligase
VKYGTTPSPDLAVFGEITECAPFLSFSWKNQSTGSNAPVHNVNTHLIGSYNIYNMLAAATIGLHFGVSEEQVDHALANYIPSNNRSQLTITSSNKLIVDTYNANPTSMNAALLNFRDMKVSPKMAILGDMRELGDVSAEEHQKVVDFLKQTDITNVWLVGSEFAKTDCDYRKFDDVDQVKEEIAANPPKDEYILIKGSNGIKLFQLPELL